MKITTIHIVLLFVFISTELIAQGDNQTIPTLSFNSNTGTLIGGPVYGRHFKIEGSTKQPFGRNSDIIELKIINQNIKNKDSIVFERVWKSQEPIGGARNDQSNSFEFYVDVLLEFETNYVYRFKFLEKNDFPTDDAAGKILDATRSDIKFQFTNRSLAITSDSVTLLFKKNIENYMVENGYSILSDDGERLINNVNVDNANFKSISDILSENNSQKISINAFQKKIDQNKPNKERLLSAYTAQIKHLDEIAKLIKYDSSDVEECLDSAEAVSAYKMKIKDLLDGISLLNGDYGYVVLNKFKSMNVEPDDTQKANIKDALTYYLSLKKELYDNGVTAKFDVSNELINNDLPNGKFKNIIQSPFPLKGKQVDLPQTIRELQNTLRQLKADTEDLDEYSNEQVGKDYKLENDLSRELSTITQLLESSSSYVIGRKEGVKSKEEVEAISIGTTFGGAAAFFQSENKTGLFKDIETDGFAYVGLKFYLSSVDKGLVEPYLRKSNENRFIKAHSILVGFMVGSTIPEYQGQPIQDAVGGLKPILGWSGDISRYLSIDAGVIFYRFPSLSAVESSNHFRFSPFVGLSLDADAFNRFKQLIQGKPYKITVN